VLLHLFTQGQLADGEVAPMSFTQGGMAERLQVGQSPLSSVLRRLVVAGLVSQDTRHVRGQPRRLRVYRLTPLGESVSRDLYHRQIPGRQYPSEADR
jgi:DNA-binding MarR family transcriptional regulator